jgi:hypothetical protein
MRLVQLLALALLATAARADTSTTCSNSISGNLADGTPYFASSDSGLFVESAFADCVPETAIHAENGITGK